METYEQQSRSINYKHGQDSINNAYGRFISQQRGSRQLGDMSRSFARAVPLQRSTFGARGLSGPGVRSGVMRQSMSNFIGDYARDRGRAEQDFSQEQGQYDLQQKSVDAWRQQALADLETSRAQQVAETARNIEALRQLLGGQ